MINNGLTALPNKNLVENIGFDEDATHTHKRRNYNPIYNHKTNFDYLKLIHPTFILRDKIADHYTEIHRFSGRNFFPTFLLKKLFKLFSKLRFLK